MKRYKPRLATERLREVLSYDPETGVFVWRLRLNAHAMPGKVAGTISNRGRRHIAVDGVVYCAHRLAWQYVHGDWPAFQIDHVNMNKLDDRMSNLRRATSQGNSANRMVLKNNKLGVKGVGIGTLRVRKPQSYRARIRVNGLLIHLGYFPTPEEANAAYAAAAKIHFGEFARSA